MSAGRAHSVVRASHVAPGHEPGGELMLRLGIVLRQGDLPDAPAAGVHAGDLPDGREVIGFAKHERLSLLSFSERHTA
ncbi:MAG TPA: hypothetical protein VG028_02970 [Terriglobia bacterium]|nr:hypothetical protein [Terriglobia bacterium]